MFFFNKTSVVILLGLTVLIFLGWYFSDIVSYFVISLVLSTILRSPVNYISQMQIVRVRVPRIIAIFISFSVFAGIITLFVLLFIPLVADQIEVITNLDYARVVKKISKPFEQIEQFLENLNFIKPNETNIELSEQNTSTHSTGTLIQKEKNGHVENQNILVRLLQGNLPNLYTSLKISTILNNILSITSNFFIGLLAVLFITFFLLYEKGILRRNIIGLIPNKYFEVTIGVVYKIERLLANYLLALFIQMFFIFTIASIGLLVAGEKYALTVALFAALANLIPYLGPVLGASFALIVSFSTALPTAESSVFAFSSLKILIVFAILQIVDNLFIQPIIFSKSIKAHPLEIFIIIFAGAAIAGPLGMVTAIPVYTILRVSYVEFLSGYKEYKIFQQ